MRCACGARRRGYLATGSFELKKLHTMVCAGETGARRPRAHPSIRPRARPPSPARHSRPPDVRYTPHVHRCAQISARGPNEAMFEQQTFLHTGRFGQPIEPEELEASADQGGTVGDGWPWESGGGGGVSHPAPR